MLALSVKRHQAIIHASLAHEVIANRFCLHSGGKDPTHELKEKSIVRLCRVSTPREQTH